MCIKCAQVALELIKVVGGKEFESFRNCFFNLAIPVVVLTEPAKVKKTMIRLEPFFLDLIYFTSCTTEIWFQHCTFVIV